MTTINDLPLTEALIAAKSALKAAEDAVRHGQEHAAFKCLMQLEHAAARAQSRLNQLRFNKEVKQ